MEGSDLNNKDRVPTDARDASRKHMGVDCLVETSGRVYTGILLDMSADGAFVKCSKSINPGTEISLVLKNPRKNTSSGIKIQAEVAHAGRFVQGFENFSGFGARFKNLPAELKSKLDEALHHADCLPERKYTLY
jgi:hypothetical protein